MVRTVRPKASETPTKPMPSPCTGPAKFAARTALPQPPSTSQKVPNSSAARRLERFIVCNPNKYGKVREFKDESACATRHLGAQILSNVAQMDCQELSFTNAELFRDKSPAV